MSQIKSPGEANHGRRLQNMTRENKLALIIGFSLILVVAILITDHFSPAQKAEFANLGPQNAHAASSSLRGTLPPGNGVQSSQPVNNGSGNPNPNLASNRNPNTTHQEQGRLLGLQPAREIAQVENTDPPITMGSPVSQNQNTHNQQSRPDDQLHAVKRNDSLYGITRRYYGDESLAKQLAAYNRDRVSADLQIREGVTLRIPKRWVLTGTAPTNNNPRTNTTRSDTNSTPQYTTYTIKSSDILGDISRKLLGTSRRWREIYELNKNVIDNPDRLTPGITIRIPPRN